MPVWMRSGGGRGSTTWCEWEWERDRWEDNCAASEGFRAGVRSEWGIEKGGYERGWRIVWFLDGIQWQSGKLLWLPITQLNYFAYNSYPIYSYPICTVSGAVLLFYLDLVPRSSYYPTRTVTTDCIKDRGWRHRGWISSEDFQRMMMVIHSLRKPHEWKWRTELKGFV